MSEEFFAAVVPGLCSSEAGKKIPSRFVLISGMQDLARDLAVEAARLTDDPERTISDADLRRWAELLVLIARWS